MSQSKTPVALDAATLPTKPSIYPEQFAARVAGRVKRALGDPFGIKKFGVNLTRLKPGAESALLHHHTRQEELIYILEGEPTLITTDGETSLGPGMCAGFAPDGPAHHLVNRTDRDVLYLEVGDRPEGDAVTYPNDDIQAVLGEDGKWRVAHKDGTPY